MREHGANVMACPHCGHDTPVFESEYDRARNPISFTVCLWCDGYIEWNGCSETPHVPYEQVTEVQTNE